MCHQQSLRSACAYAQSDQSLCYSLEYYMIVKLLTEHHLEFLSLKGGCRGPSESTHVKMPNCWKSHALAQLFCLGKSSCLIYSMVQWSWYSQWENARVMHRGEEYNTLKTRVGHRMWERAQEIYPKIKGKVIIKLEVGSNFDPCHAILLCTLHTPQILSLRILESKICKIQCTFFIQYTTATPFDIKTNV